jgi:hypothetical protein
MTTFVYDEYHHVTGFEMFWPDGTYKPSFLLTSVRQLAERDIQSNHLRQYRFREGIDFMVVGASELPDTLLNQKSMRGSRTVLSFSGLLRLVLRGTSDFSIRVQEWVVDDVITDVLRNGYYRRADIDEMFDRLLRHGDDGPTLGDLIGTDL